MSGGDASGQVTGMYGQPLEMAGQAGVYLGICARTGCFARHDHIIQSSNRVLAEIFARQSFNAIAIYGRSELFAGDG